MPDKEYPKEEERRNAFIAEFNALMKKYDAELTIEDFGHDWTVKDEIVVEFNGMFEGDDQKHGQYLGTPNDIRLGTWCDEITAD